MIVENIEALENLVEYEDAKLQAIYDKCVNKVKSISDKIRKNIENVLKKLKEMEKEPHNSECLKNVQDQVYSLLKAIHKESPRLPNIKEIIARTTTMMVENVNEIIENISSSIEENNQEYLEDFESLFLSSNLAIKEFSSNTEKQVMESLGIVDAWEEYYNQNMVQIIEELSVGIVKCSLKNDKEEL